MRQAHCFHNGLGLSGSLSTLLKSDMKQLNMTLILLDLRKQHLSHRILFHEIPFIIIMIIRMIFQGNGDIRHIDSSNDLASSFISLLCGMLSTLFLGWRGACIPGNLDLLLGEILVEISPCSAPDYQTLLTNRTTWLQAAVLLFLALENWLPFVLHLEDESQATCSSTAWWHALSPSGIQTEKMF